MMKKLIAFALVAVMAVGVLVACRAPEDTGASSTTTTATTVATTTSTTAPTSAATTVPTTGTLDSTATTGGAKMMPRMR